MSSLTTLVQALGIAYASGISPYATVALAGIASRMGWIDSLPGALGAVSHPAVIVLASALTVIEFLATLIPGVASLWETIHTAIRPPAAAALAVLTAWHGDPALMVAAGLLGGGLGFATLATKLGLRYTMTRRRSRSRTAPPTSRSSGRLPRSPTRSGITRTSRSRSRSPSWSCSCCSFTRSGARFGEPSEGCATRPRARADASPLA